MSYPHLPDEETAKHPCYSEAAHHQYARMHIPVAPACNLSCNYCNRKFDCVNESRPGVTSEILTPAMSKAKFEWVKKEIPQLTVVGIAGPGDALANWKQVKQSILLIKECAPEIIFCLSTNGLLLPEYAEELVALGIRHITITINCLEPSIGAQLYRRIEYHGQEYRGETAAKILLKNQLTGLRYLAQQGVFVKVNIVMVPGINDRHIPEVVKKVRELGAMMTNIMPLIPAAGSAFEHFPQTNMQDIRDMRNRCEAELPQMRHCQQCRADAIGLLTQDQSYRYRFSQPKAEEPGLVKDVYRIAVTTKYNRLVDLHYGHALKFYIYQVAGSASCLLEIREAPQYCHGRIECDEAEAVKQASITVISDCDAVLTMRVGDQARERLAKRGILAIESCNTVDEGLTYAYQRVYRVKHACRREII